MDAMSQQEEEESMSLITAVYRKYWVDNRERIMEIYRTYFHTIFVTLLMIVNLVTAYSAVIIYLAQWKHKSGSVEGFLSLLLPYPSHFLTSILNIPFFGLDLHMTWWCLVFLNLPIITWFYSTVTQPIKKGYSTYIDWKSRKGRVISAVINGCALIVHYCAIFAWYVENYLFHFFEGIKSDEAYLVINSMASFGYILMCIPVFISITGTYLLMKQFHMNEDLRKMFFKWEFSLLASQSFSLRSKKADVIIGWEKATHKPIVLVEENRFLHELVNGATGTGKTSTTILTRIVQDLIRIARGGKLGVCVLEPKGDLIRDVLNLCKKLGIPESKIKVIDPTDLIRSVKFNPFVGPLETAAETFRGVLDALAGDQDEFFKGQQSETASLYTMLGKIRHGNMFSIVHMQRMYSDPRYLADMTEEVRSWITRNLESPTLTEENRVLLERYDRVCSYFENEVIEFKTWKDKEHRIMPVLYPDGHKYEGKQVVENKKDKFITGAKKYINDICMNAMLSQLMVAKDGEEVLDIDKFLAEGGVLLVNTALGELEELSMSFGQFFIRQFQSSVFRRPSEESGFERFPIFFNIDEFPLFINEAFVRLLTLGRSYKVGTLIAIQSLGQLESVIRGYDRTIMSNASNKTVFGRGEVTDNELFSKQFGEEYEVEESMNESVTPVSQPNPTLGYRYNTARQLAPRFTPTKILEQEFKHFIVQLVGEDGAIQVPVQAYGKFISETKFLKRFIKIGQAELETSKYKSVGSPTKWIQKLAIDTVQRINPLDKLFTTEKNKLQERVGESEEEVQNGEQQHSEIRVRAEVTGEASETEQQHNALRVRTEVNDERIEKDAEQKGREVVEETTEPIIASDQKWEEDSRNDIVWAQMPDSPHPSGEENVGELTGFNSGVGADAPHIRDTNQSYSQPNEITDSVIGMLVRTVTGEQGENQTIQTNGHNQDKPLAEWNINDLIATDVVSGQYVGEEMNVGPDPEKPGNVISPVQQPDQSVKAKSPQQNIASGKVLKGIDIENDDI
ncbi:TraM recognition domain-containing protein [Paenibacillus periandrae]|uniref:TraM recognition domain-containing protein n=1 Tax=Paenibacillus periandrae TaxID=1761741 RepID=UPI001F08F3BD|nr:TraM recognition domain-containing protein [Paenibacillus periandrae]